MNYFSLVVNRNPLITNMIVEGNLPEFIEVIPVGVIRIAILQGH